MSKLKLSIVTITCRQQPRLEDMLSTLAASYQRVANDVEIDWIIVDDLQRTPQLLTPDEGFTIDFVVHKSKYRDPSRGEKLPAHNDMRQAGLERAVGDYVLFLEDCTLVTRNLIELVRDCAAQNLGLRVRAYPLIDIAVPTDGVLVYRDKHDTLHDIPPHTAVSACWGAPRAAFDKIGGFDPAYNGEEKFHDIDTSIRLARAGVRFVSSERANVVTLRRTKNKNEITTNRKSLVGANNTRLYNGLLRDKTRFLPSAAQAPKLVASPASKPSAAAASNARVGRDPASLMATNLKRYCDVMTLMKSAQGGDLAELATEAESLYKRLGHNERTVAARKVGPHVMPKTETPPMPKTETPPMPSSSSDWDLGDIEKPVS